MSSLRHAVLIVVSMTAAACLALAACAYQVTGYVEQPKTTARSNAKYTYVVVNWVGNVDELAGKCREIPNRVNEACAWVVRDRIFRDTTSCTVYAIEPRDFDDAALLAILGHEFWHCLGATHLKE